MVISISNFLFSLAFICWVSPGCRQAGITEEVVENKTIAPSQFRKKVKIESTGKIQPPSSNALNQIAPGYCRMVGQIVSIIPALAADKKDPCGKVPCQANVKVKRIIGYGSAFGSSVGEGSQIIVNFSFTLHLTHKYFPELTTHLPGLQVGQTFQADIREIGDNKTQEYQVNEYQIK